MVISGPPAVGKSTVARRIADHYDMRCMSGGDVLKEMARELGFDPDGADWWDTPQGMKFLAMREDDFQFDHRMDQHLLGVCREGNTVITSYTLPWLTGTPVRVWLECSLDVSAQRLRQRDGLDVHDAYSITDDRCRRNTLLYQKHYGFKFGWDDSVFDIMVNTEDKNVEQVIAELVAKLDDMI